MFRLISASLFCAGCLVCDVPGHGDSGRWAGIDGGGHLCPLLCAAKHTKVRTPITGAPPPPKKNPSIYKIEIHLLYHSIACM